MKESQPIHNSQWVAHCTTNESVFELTLRETLVECKAAYIMEYIIVLEVDDNLDGLYLIREYGDQIPSDVKFVIVKLVPDFSTEIS